MTPLLLGYDMKPPEYYDCKRPEMLELVPLDARKVLEVGCGRGVFSGSLKARQESEVWGIELCKDVAKDARIILDRVITADIEKDNIDLPKAYFDCIVFNDVLEHLRDPWMVLMNLRAHLSDDGCIVASIPNIRYLPTLKALVLHKEWKYVDAGILDRTHLRFFTEKSVGDLFETSGYKVIMIKGICGRAFSWKFRLFNWLSGQRFEDTKYFRFACIAKQY